MTPQPTMTVKLTPLLSSLRHALSGVAMAALLTVVAACASAPTKAPAHAHGQNPTALSDRYQGLFLAACTELTEGLYYADAMQLKPIDATHVEAAYFKAFFSTTDCAGNSRLVRFALPVATWKIVGQTLIGDKMVDQVLVTLPAGPMTVVISNPDKVKETSDQFVISYGTQNGSIPLQKLTKGSVDKELRLIEGAQLFMSDAAPSDSPDGFPSALLDSAPFERH
jgi:hypothetical protein